MRILRLGPGADGQCHFSEVDIAHPVLVPGAGLEFSTSVASTAVEFVTLPDGLDLGFHPSGRRLLLIVLTGSVEVSVPDGESHVFERGDVFLSDDIDTSGHASRTVGGPAEMLFITVPDGASWQTPSTT